MPKKVNLSYKELSGQDFSGQNLRWADLSNCNLSGAVLRNTDLRHANLGGANLTGALLDYAPLHNANLWKAKLQAASLENARLEFVNANSADFTDANLTGIRCSGMDVTYSHAFAMCAPVRLQSEPAYGNWRNGDIWVGCGFVLSYQPLAQARAAAARLNRFEAASLAAALTFIEFTLLQEREILTTALDEWTGLFVPGYKSKGKQL